MKSLRKCVKELPLREGTTCMVHIAPDGTILFANSLAEKRSLSNHCKMVGGQLLAVWPGKMSSHAFKIDDAKLAQLEQSDDEVKSQELKEAVERGSEGLRPLNGAQG